MAKHAAEPAWKYGFYDSDDSSRTVYWHVFGILTHDTAESAERTGSKSVLGSPVIVRRRDGETDWEHVTTEQQGEPRE